MAEADGWSARRWAIEMTRLWMHAAPGERFPVDVEAIALEMSAHRHPADPIKAIEGASLPKFEGALYPIDGAAPGWAIIYNDAGVREGRKRFTIAHEFGHYLLHRKRLPKGIECDEKAVIRRDGRGIEREADEFAAWVLMPLDDFRAQIAASDKPTIDQLGAAAERYGVSLTAATLRWLEYTDRRALFLVSRDYGALWARSSAAAFKTGRFIQTASETYMLPEQSLAVQSKWDAEGGRRGHSRQEFGSQKKLRKPPSTRKISTSRSPCFTCRSMSNWPRSKSPKRQTPMTGSYVTIDDRSDTPRQLGSIIQAARHMDDVRFRFQRPRCGALSISALTTTKGPVASGVGIC
jgi:hypothetical protein